MSRIHPVQVLLDEHAAIEQVLDAMAWSLARLETEPVAWDVLRKALDFLEHFADRCHHDKEEMALFPLLRRKGLSGDAEAVIEMHRTGHVHLLAIERELEAARRDPQARAFVVAEGITYIKQMREHLRGENDNLFELARQVLTAQDIAELDRLFLPGESHAMDDATYDKYLALADELARVTAPGGVA